MLPVLDFRLQTPDLSSVVVVVFVFVAFFEVFLGDVEFYGIESDDLKLRRAFVARDRIAFVGVEVNVDFGFAVRARSYRHCSFLRVLFWREARPT
ncbi:MAG: hypothetical protein QOH51_1486 [Acidobacteriota bacterium]|nr:hypothetical protein [Acidobacteriota bacterium]